MKDLPTIISDLKQLTQGKPWGLADRLAQYTKVLEAEVGPKPLTRTQMNSIYLFCQQLSDTLNTLGLEMRVVLKPSYQIWWDKQSVHDHLWITIQQLIFGTDSVKDLKKLGEIEKVHERLMKMLIDKFAQQGLEWIEFPHQEINQDNYKQMADNIRIK